MPSSQASDVAVPLLDLVAQYQPLRQEILDAIVRVCDSQRFILGPEVEALERELADRLEAPHAIAVSSGTDALLVTMMALGIGPGHEVITPTYSFFATAGCVRRLGATPVFVDIDPVTFNLDPRLVERAITPRTRAILPVHLYGLCAELDPIVAIAARASVPDDTAIACGDSSRSASSRSRASTSGPRMNRCESQTRTIASRMSSRSGWYWATRSRSGTATSLAWDGGMSRFRINSRRRGDCPRRGSRR